MADIEKTIKSLESNNFTVKFFENAEAAAEWLAAEALDGGPDEMFRFVKVMK